MGRSQETFNKKAVRNRKEKKRKEKEKKRLERKEREKKSGLDDMIAYVDENGNITSTPPDLSNKKETKPEDIEIGPPKKEELDPNEVRTGIVAYFNEKKGYGFIKDSETRESIFVHVKDLNDEIEEGNNVTYNVEKGKRGLTACNVNIAK